MVYGDKKVGSIAEKNHKLALDRDLILSQAVWTDHNRFYFVGNREENALNLDMWII